MLKSLRSLFARFITTDDFGVYAFRLNVQSIFIEITEDVGEAP